MSGVASTLAKKRAEAAGFGTNSNAVPYLNQNFQALRAQFRSSGRLFCDPTFPAEPESLGFNELGRNSSKTRGVTWKRPTVRTEPEPGRMRELEGWVWPEPPCRKSSCLGSGSGSVTQKSREYQHSEILRINWTGTTRRRFEQEVS